MGKKTIENQTTNTIVCIQDKIGDAAKKRKML